MSFARLFARPVTTGAVLVWLGAVAGSANAALRVTELNLGCLDGSRNVAFVEVKPVSSDTFDPGVGLEVRGADNAVLFDLPGVFGTHSGAFPLGRSFLLATSAFQAATGLAPDAWMPSAPDPEAGRITLYRLAADGVTRQVLDQFTYGPTSLEPPPPGWSLFWDGISRNLTSQPTPEGYRLGAIQSPCFGAGAPPSGSGRFALQELFLQCEDGGTSTQFAELVCAGAGWSRSTVQLRVFDRNGDRQGVLSGLFGSRNGSSLFAGETALQGNAGITPVDGALPVTLDPVGGRLECWEGTYLDFSVRWGPDGETPPPPGQSLHYDGGWSAGRPSPTTVTGFPASPVGPACFAEVATGVRIGKVLVQCEDGSTTDQFVELEPWSFDARYWRDLALEVRTPGGALLQRVPVDFGPYAGLGWYGNPWLIAPNDFEGPYTGVFQPDSRAALDLPIGGGQVWLVQHTLADTSRVLDTFAYGPGATPLPAPGWALRRGFDGSWAPERAMAMGTRGSYGFTSCFDLCEPSTIQLPLVTRHYPFAGSWSLYDGVAWGSIDHSGRSARATAYAVGEAKTVWVDEFVVTGLPPGTPTMLYLTGQGYVYGQSESCLSGQCAKGAAWVQFRHSSGIEAGEYAGAGEYRTVYEGFPFEARAGEPFRITVEAHALIETGSTGMPAFYVQSSADGSFYLSAANPAVHVSSCKAGIVLLQGTVGAPPAGPAPVQLAIRKVMPNPLTRDSQLLLAVPRAAAVALEVIDIAGRRVFERDLGVLTPGEHHVPLGARDALRPGFYLVRVRQQGESATSRVLVTK